MKIIYSLYWMNLSKIMPAEKKSLTFGHFVFWQLLFDKFIIWHFEFWQMVGVPKSYKCKKNSQKIDNDFLTLPMKAPTMDPSAL